MDTPFGNRAESMQIAEEKEQMQWQKAIFFDPEDSIYREHFPGNPVVPGSLIAYAFMEAARGIGFDRGPFEIENLRFRNFISPGEYPCTIRVSGDKLTFKLYNGKKIAASGTLRV